MVDVPTPPFASEVSKDLFLSRMLVTMASDLDRAEGSMAYSLLSPFAIELDILHDQLDLAVSLGFAQTTYGEFLDARAEEHGVFRREAAVASGEVTFSGANGTQIPSGTLVSTVGSSESAPIVFSVTAQGQISGGSVVLPIVAVLAGAEANVPIGAISQMVGGISGVTSVTNVVATSGGADRETDEIFRERLLDAMAAGRGAGTSGDYEVWAREVAGVGFAKTTPLHVGAGTVLVNILDVDRQPASAGLLTAVTDYIATLSPIGADVTVDTPAVNVVDVDVTLVLESGFTVPMVEAAVTEAIEAYFAILDPGDDVVLSEVGAVIVTSDGVADYTGLTLDTVAANKVIATTEIAEVGAVTIA